jgi:hypothetical protein
MKIDGEEKRIRRLFSEMSSADERLAPEFAGTLESAGAIARARRIHRRPTEAALAIACAALVLLAILVARHARPQTAGGPDEQIAAQSRPPETPGSGNSNPLPGGVDTGAGVKRVVKRVRHRRSPNDLTIAIEPLLAWRSPTASLLKAPNDVLLKSLPRLGESLQIIESLSSDRFN